MPGKSEKSSGYGTACAFSNGKGARPQLFSGRLKRLYPPGNVMQLKHLRAEIERMRTSPQAAR
jgi:hypothetical protein